MDGEKFEKLSLWRFGGTLDTCCTHLILSHVCPAAAVSPHAMHSMLQDTAFSRKCECRPALTLQVVHVHESAHPRSYSVSPHKARCTLHC